MFLSISSCCKDKEECVTDSIALPVFWQVFGNFYCNNSNPVLFYVYKQSSVDSIVSSLDCHFFGNGTAFPLEDLNYLYLGYGDTTFYYKDTILADFQKDTCNKIVYCNLKMKQRTETLNDIVGVSRAFYVIEGVPSNYSVQIKKERVGL